MDLQNLAYRALRRLKLQPVLNWNARLPSVNIAVPLLGGALGSGLMLYGNSWKPELFRRLAATLPISTALDVGGNEGQTIVDLLSAGLVDLEVLTFEPNPTCAYYLQKLVRLNGWSRVTVLPFALSDAVRCLELELSAEENNSGASLVPDLRPGLEITQRQLVPCFSLDELAAGKIVRLTSNFLFKIDVEGAELDVLKGATEVLRKTRPVVVCEVLWAHCAERVEFMRERNAKLFGLLESNDYDVFRIVLTQNQRTLIGIQRISGEFPCGIYSRENAHECEYLFVPKELSEQLAAAISRA